MRIGKLQLLALVVGAVILGGVASVTAQEETEAPSSDEAPKRAMMHHGGFGKHAIRSEAVVPGAQDGTFRTIRHDRGELAAISGDTLRIEEADGHVAQVTVSEDTNIRRDGEEATLGDLEVGDRVFTVQVDDGDGFATKAVKAISSERYAEMEAKREACREDPEPCRQRFRERRMQRRGDAPADFVPPADVVPV